MKPRSSSPWSSSPAAADSPSEIACRAGGLRREVRPRRVGAAHDQGEAREVRLALQAEELEHGVEAAARSLVLVASTPSMSNGTAPVSFAHRQDELLGST